LEHNNPSVQEILNFPSGGDHQSPVHFGYNCHGRRDLYASNARTKWTETSRGKVKTIMQSLVTYRKWKL